MSFLTDEDIKKQQDHFMALSDDVKLYTQSEVNDLLKKQRISCLHAVDDSNSLRGLTQDQCFEILDIIALTEIKEE